MPPVYYYDEPSSLADVVAQVRDLFDAIGDPTPIMIGKRYLASGAGSDARVLFVPETGSGKIGPPIEMGNSWSVTSTCKVYCRAAESGDDIDRFKAAYALVRLALNALRRAAAGRLDGGKFGDASPADDDAFGADLSFEFSYQWDVRQSAKINGVAAQPAGSTTPVPGIPPGIPASQTNIDPAMSPAEN